LSQTIYNMIWTHGLFIYSEQDFTAYLAMESFN